jgi:hypothetical protein
MKLRTGQSRAFSHAYRFRGAGNARIQQLNEYLIET